MPKLLNDSISVIIGEDDKTSDSDENGVLKCLYKTCCLAKKSNSVQDNEKEETNEDNLKNDQPCKQASEFLQESTFHRR